MLRSSTRGQPAIEPGGLYRRSGGEFVETAEVIELGRDPMGIPHVRFKVHLTRSGGIATAEQRTLSLDSFSARYRERVEKA